MLGENKMRQNKINTEIICDICNKKIKVYEKEIGPHEYIISYEGLRLNVENISIKSKFKNKNINLNLFICDKCVSKKLKGGI